MKWIFAVTILLSCATPLCISEDSKEIKWESLTLLSGKTYNDVTVTKVEADLIRIRHAAGLASVPFKDIPAELHQQLGYNPAAAKEVTAAKNQQAAAMANARALDQKRFGGYYRNLQHLQEWRTRYTTSSNEQPLTSQEQAFRTRKADDTIQDWKNKITLLKQIVQLFDREGVQEAEIQKNLDSVLDEQVFKGMLAPMVELSWGAPDNISSIEDTTTEIEVWRYDRSETKSQSITIVNNVVTEITSYSF
ncbi:MAG: hypothetical protein P1U87_20010 [Verrucomicrobiales bacterium]|nr:hypothetical protein [Verrucomicrobiales bacterium]